MQPPLLLIRFKFKQALRPLAFDAAAGAGYVGVGEGGGEGEAQAFAAGGDGGGAYREYFHALAEQLGGALQCGGGVAYDERLDVAHHAAASCGRSYCVGYSFGMAAQRGAFSVHSHHLAEQETAPCHACRG